MHEDEYPDEELDDEVEIDEKDWNAQTLSIRSADGEEVLTIVAHGEEWSTYMQPGGGVRNAYLGTAGDPTVWVDAAGTADRARRRRHVLRPPRLGPTAAVS